MMIKLKEIKFLLILMLFATQVVGQQKATVETKLLKKYITYFNSLDTEAVKNYIPNAQAFDWLATNIPLLECPDKVIEQNYYYRWWTFRKHLVKTPDGFIFYRIY
jgi:hypothetical protein